MEPAATSWSAPPKAEADLREAEKASEPFDAEYERRGGWPRYLLCMGTSNGHIHRTLSGHWTASDCPSLTPGRTLVAPVFSLSGRDDDAVVEECGHKACTKCFPEAPVLDRTAPDPDACPGSGSYVDDWRARYVVCPECRATVSVTRGGKLHKHKRKEA